MSLKNCHLTPSAYIRYRIADIELNKIRKKKFPCSIFHKFLYMEFFRSVENIESGIQSMCGVKN